MPFVDLLSGDDYASIWYITNSEHMNVGGFHPEKPTIIMLHPNMLDTTWLSYQFEDPRLRDYNVIAFDMRLCGRSRASPSALHDPWVEAADLALACQHLWVPPAHIIAFDTLSVLCALRFAALFPEMCLSLALCNVPPPKEVEWVFNSYDEILQSWCFAEDVDSFHHACKEALQFIVGNNCEEDVQDDVIAWWEVFIPPFRRLRVVETLNVVLNREPLNSKQLARVTQPVLILQGENADLFPREYADQLARDLVNAKDPRVLEIKGATGSLALSSGTAAITNSLYTKFLSRLPPSRSIPKRPAVSVAERMKLALETLSDLTGDPAIAARDPESSLSFSCVSPEVRKSQHEALAFYARGRSQALSPLGSDGRPVRKYSEKSKDHWFYSDQDGSSYAGSLYTRALEKHRRDQITEGRQDFITRAQSKSELVSSDLAFERRIRRTTFNPSTVDKHIIKGSMSKVVASTGSFKIQSLLKSSLASDALD